jgi:sialate O-acetylesterase
LLPALISDWRSRFGVGEFPFLIVQLANFMDRKAEPGESAWAELREAQLLTARRVPKAGLAVAIDIGEAKDIHPRNKQDVGRRLALAARSISYGEKLTFSGPVYRSMRREGRSIRLEFDHVGGGLAARGAKLEGFAIAGADKKFVWADARIDGETVLVSSPSVSEPVAVRYGWADNPTITLYNLEGLPASPFRTDGGS